MDAEIGLGNAVVIEFEVEDPLPEFGFCLGIAEFGALEGDIAEDITVAEDGITLGKPSFDRRGKFLAVLGKEQGDQLRMHLGDRAKFATQEPCNELSKHAFVVPREVNKPRFYVLLLKMSNEELDLRGFPRAVKPFDHDEFSSLVQCFQHTVAISGNFGQRWSSGSSRKAIPFDPLLKRGLH